MPEKQKMTKEEVILIHEIAREVYKDRMYLKDGLDFLEKEMKMKKGSARMYINAFKAMKKGECYKMEINKPATIYFIEQIFIDDGKDGLELALKALEKHIEHKVNYLRTIHEGFSAKLK